MSNGGIGVGRIVHYVLAEDGGKHRPAIVTEVVGDSGGGPEGGKARGDPHVNLSVFFDRRDGRYEAVGQYEAVPYDEGKTKHTWHWPERT